MTAEKLRAADPRVISTELGKLVSLELGGELTIRFPRQPPILSYNEGGLLIGGGGYAVEGGRVVPQVTNVRELRPRAEDARQIAKETARYQRDHWGQPGWNPPRRLPMADPRKQATRIEEIVAVTYCTKKGTDTRRTDYRHPFKRPRPVLAWNPSGLLILGGVYHVTERGIID